jgi:hypothetical protein
MSATERNAETGRTEAIKISPGPEFRIALLLAILADALQLAIIPLFIEGAESPAADVVDLAMAGLLFFLLGWHWEFLPSFLGKLVPGVDLVPLWTLAVANVYRKSKRDLVVSGASGRQG